MAIPDTTARKCGFTLVEMMMASMIGVFLIAGVFSAFIFQRRVFEVQQRVNEMQQNVRTGLEFMARDIHMAGYGLRNIPPDKVGEWVDWVTGMTDNPMVIQGSFGAPDSLLVAAAFGKPVATLQAAATNGATVITVSSDQGVAFNTTDKKVIYIGHTETARVVSRAGDTLTISCDPVDIGKGLMYAYQPGTQIELVRLIRYEWRNPTTSYPFEPHIIREKTEQSYVAEWQKICTGNIDDIQYTRNTYDVDVTLTGRTSKPDPNYTHPQKGDGYRRMTITRGLYPRNARLWR